MSSATLYPHLTLAADGFIHIGTTRDKAIHLAAEHYQFGWGGRTAPECCDEPELWNQVFHLLLRSF